MHLFISDTVGMSALCQSIDKCDPVGTFKLQKFHKTSSVPFDMDTVQKTNLVPWPMPEKEDYPWAVKKKYGKAIMSFEGSSVHSNS
jgi:hypothetical protein